MSLEATSCNTPPFVRSVQLCHGLDEQGEKEATTDPEHLFQLPGYPNISMQHTKVLEQFVKREFWSDDLEIVAPHLWILSTQSSSNVSPLHHQKVKGREIVVTESPRLHLVWINNRIFIKPLPEYLLSYRFWTVLAETSQSHTSQRSITMAAKGFLRTYRHLIQHQSDFIIAQQDDLKLVPKQITWPKICQFLDSVSQISDSDVSERYQYGELRLSRLNLYAPILLRKFNYEQVHGQYADYFAGLYGPILFIFAIISTILNAMQVEIAVEEVSAVDWVTLWFICRWFSTISLAATATISLVVIFLWVWMVCDEWQYAIRCRWRKRRGRSSRSAC